MISELVMFGLPKGIARDAVIDDMRAVAPHWQAQPDLIRKTFLYDPQGGVSGALYTWKNLAAAQRAHDEAWRARIVSRYGSEPSIRYFDTPLIVDNALGTVVEADRPPPIEV